MVLSTHVRAALSAERAFESFIDRLHDFEAAAHTPPSTLSRDAHLSRDVVAQFVSSGTAEEQEVEPLFVRQMMAQRGIERPENPGNIVEGLKSSALNKSTLYYRLYEPGEVVHGAAVIAAYLIDGALGLHAYR
eukprot:GHVU01009747.1.p1 GENE.GHVU01009747.1~~GHVU01009747.1.p1  ORF type:complete len:133 (-),score=17.07 GHVU01009747.1:248-646(-)